MIPDHWVALTSPVRIDGASTIDLFAQGGKINDDNTLASRAISFDVFTWGEPSYPVQKRRLGLSVETCIDYFYGYVAAK